MFLGMLMVNFRDGVTIQPNKKNDLGFRQFECFPKKCDSFSVLNHSK